MLDPPLTIPCRSFLMAGAVNVRCQSGCGSSAQPGGVLGLCACPEPESRYAPSPGAQLVRGVLAMVSGRHRYTGVDVHAHECTICASTAADRIVEPSRLCPLAEVGNSKYER